MLAWVWGKGNAYLRSKGMQTDIATVETMWLLFKMLEIDLSYEPTPGHGPKRLYPIASVFAYPWSLLLQSQ